MSEIPGDLRYTRTHEWLRQLPDGAVQVGISDHAQGALGDLVFVELPDVGRTVAAGEAVAVVESVKAASDVYSPIAGEIVAVNEQLGSAPELVNQQPYAQGWLFTVKPSSSAGEFLDAAAYAAVAEG